MENHLDWVKSAPGLHISDCTYVIPDLVFISRASGGIIGAANIEAAPDLVCEILSPSTRRQDALTKRAQYARIGVREYWLIDPATQIVTVLALEAGGYTEVVPTETKVVRSRVLPGLFLTLDDLFEDVDIAPSDEPAD